MKQKMKKLGHFTLLELLVVVAILAILAGGLLVAYDGLQAQAAKSEASFSISSVDRAVRTYTAVEKTAPNELDSLIAATYSTASVLTLNPDSGMSAPETAGISADGTVHLRKLSHNTVTGVYSYDTQVIVVPVLPLTWTDTIEAAGAALGDDGIAPDTTANDGEIDGVADTTVTIDYDDFLYMNAAGVVDVSGTSALAASLAKIGKKLQVVNLGVSHVESLNNAGITQLRYLDEEANKVYDPSVGTNDDSLLNAGGKSFGTNFWIDRADIPNRVFDDAVKGKNRGRGFKSTIVPGIPVAIWKPGVSGENVVKLGGQSGTISGSGEPFANVFVAFGLGNNASMVGVKSETSAVGDVSIASAPSYGDVKSNQYSRYVLLYNLCLAEIDPVTKKFAVASGTGELINFWNSAAKAKLVAVVDARGDFLDEELAEASGQKQ